MESKESRQQKRKPPVPGPRSWRGAPVWLSVDGKEQLFWAHPDGTAYLDREGDPKKGPGTLRRVKDQMLLGRVFATLRQEHEKEMAAARRAQAIAKMVKGRDVDKEGG